VIFFLEPEIQDRIWLIEIPACKDIGCLKQYRSKLDVHFEPDNSLLTSLVIRLATIIIVFLFYDYLTTIEFGYFRNG